MALAVALSGTSYAVTVLPRNSVGTQQLKDSAVVSAKVKDASLLKKDFKAGELPAGEPGEDGADGAPGDPGPAGLNWRGKWKDGAGYVLRDAVEWEGSAWVLVKEDPETPPDADEKEGAWSLLAARGKEGPEGEQGEPGVSFGGSYTSPNGLYSLSITDAGIQLGGPLTSVRVGPTSSELMGPTGSVKVSALGAQLTGGLITLNGCTRPVARQGDAVGVTEGSVTLTPGGSITGTGNFFGAKTLVATLGYTNPGGSAVAPATAWVPVAGLGTPDAFTPLILTNISGTIVSGTGTITSGLGSVAAGSHTVCAG